MAAQVDDLRRRLEKNGDEAAIGELGLALHCSRKKCQGHESIVRRAVVRLLDFAKLNQSPICDSTEFWVAYAESNLLAWRRAGARRQYLRAALEGWNRAEELGETMRHSWLAQRAEVLIFCGDYAAATMQLGALLDATERLAERRSMVLKVAMIYQHGLKHHAQAISLIYRLAMAGTIRLLSSADVLFLLARAYECWGYALETEANNAAMHQSDDETLASQQKLLRDAEVAFETSHGMFKKLHSSLLCNKSTCELTAREVVPWLNDLKTWRSLGDKCAYAGFHLFAADLYDEGARRNSAGCGRNHWLRLAKIQRLCGRDQLARDALRCAQERSTSFRLPQLVALERMWDVEQELDPSGEKMDDVDCLKELIASLPIEDCDRSRAATAIASRVRGNIARQVFHESESEIRARTFVDAGVDTPYSFESVAPDAIRTPREYRSTAVVSESPAPSPAPVDEDTVELSMLREERKQLSARVQSAQDALEAAEAAFQAAVMEQHTRATDLIPCPHDTYEKMSQATLDSDFAGAESVSSIDNHSSNWPTCSVVTKDTLRLGIDLMSVQKERVNFVLQLQSTIEQAMIAEARARHEVAAKCAEQARAARELFEKMLMEAQRETQTARQRLSVSEKLLHTSRLESEFCSKVAAARRRADGEVVFARAIKSQLMVRIVWKLPNFEVEAIDASDGTSYNLVVSDVDPPVGKARETAAQLAKRLFVNPNNQLALLDEPTSAPAIVSDLGGVCVASGVVEERRQRMDIQDEAVVSCRSASLAFRTILQGKKLAKDRYLSRLHMALTDCAAKVASRYVKSALDSVCFLEPAMPTRTPRNSLSSDLERDIPEASSTIITCERHHVPALESKARHFGSVKKHCVRLPPIDRCRERESVSDENILVTQYKHFGYIPKSIRRNFDKWRSLIENVEISAQHIKALQTEFPTLRTDALHCALAAEHDDLKAVRAKLQNDSRYVQELLVVVAAVDVRSLIESKADKSYLAVRMRSSQHSVMKKLSSVNSSSQHRTGVVAEIQALLVDPSRERLQPFCSHKAALIRRKYLRTVKSPVDLGSRRRRFRK